MGAEQRRVGCWGFWDVVLRMQGLGLQALGM